MKLIWNYILIVLIIWNFGLTIILIVQSDKNDNKIGAVVGYILMTFLLIFPISLYLVGKYFVEYYNSVFIFVFGFLIFYIGIILLVGLSPNATEGFTPSQGICFENGKQGYIINGVCDITNTRNCEAEVQQSIKKTCPQSSGTRSAGAGAGAGSISSSSSIATASQEPFMPENTVIGICSYVDNGKTIFGFRHPTHGQRCLTKEEMLKDLKEDLKDKERSKKVLWGHAIHKSDPFQSTQCQKYPKDDYISFDIECKKKFGINYGLQSIEHLGCAPNDYFAKCGAGWQAGELLPENSTKCVPVGKDMNVVCQKKHVDDKSRKFGNYLRIGYKTIEFSGCPKGSQRAICDGNYYDGKELLEKTTPPFPQTDNPNRKCQDKYGLLSFAKRIISDNCAVGYIRAECK
jgi:hypothetical protein